MKRAYSVGTIVTAVLFAAALAQAGNDQGNGKPTIAPVLPGNEQGGGTIARPGNDEGGGMRAGNDQGGGRERQPTEATA